MKEKLRIDLFDNNIASLVNKHIYFLHKPEAIKGNTYIEYEIIDERYNDYSANNNRTIEYLIQVDIFSKEDYTNVENTIKNILKKKGYKFVNGADMYEGETGLYHKAMRYNFKLLV